MTAQTQRKCGGKGTDNQPYGKQAAGGKLAEFFNKIHCFVLQSIPLTNANNPYGQPKQGGSSLGYKR